MGLGSFIWYGGGAGVAVLYSVVVGAVREFWVKTKKYDVKVHEIPDEIENPYPPDDIDGNPNGVPGVNCSSDTIRVWARSIAYQGVNSSASSASTAVQSAYFPGIPADSPPTSTSGIIAFEVNPDYDVSDFNGIVRDISEYTTSGGFLWWTTSIVYRLQINQRRFIQRGGFQNGSTFGVVNANYYRTDISRGQTSAFLSAFLAAIPESGLIEGESDISYEIALVGAGGCDSTNPGGPPGGPEFIPNPYEAFTSALKPKIFALIKSNVDESDEEFGELAYKKLIGETVSDLGSTADPDDWRGLAVSLTPTAEITSPDSCLEDYLDTDDGALIDGNLYRIALNQTISGSTLRTRLQTSPDTVTATLTTQTATSGATCTLGTATTSTVQVPSPGRGTIEGITYLP
jgi:hypothetical protein